MNRKGKAGRNWIICLLVAVLCAGGGTLLWAKGALSPVDSGDASVETAENQPEVELMDFSHEPENVIYLAGGCFWGMERLMQAIPGVIDAQSGYANGRRAQDANYQAVCRGDTGFRETVRGGIRPGAGEPGRAAAGLFLRDRPYSAERQGNDVGTQYQTGVYYTNDKAKEAVERIAGMERSRQDILRGDRPVAQLLSRRGIPGLSGKNPGGYCHVPLEEIQLFSHLRIDPGDYQKPAAEAIRDKLTREQYAVTQEGGTEYAFRNEFWDQFEKGIYVDVVTGEPLFSSADKFHSSCGWPAFSKPIEAPAIVELEDHSYGMERTEVRSRAGNSHLGHVFWDDPESPNGVRYCINSAALRFVPYAHMEAEGYGYLLDLFP